MPMVVSRVWERAQEMPPTPFSASTAVVSSPACAYSSCTKTRTVLLPSVPNHAHHAVKMYLPGAAHPHCTCTRLEVLSKGLAHTKAAVLGRRAIKKTGETRKPLHSSAVHTAAAQFLAGAFGGASATYSTHWLDTIKVRMQTFPTLYPNCTLCVKTILKEGGMSALYQGAVPAVTGHAVKASAVFMSYGLCQELVWRMSTAAGLTMPCPNDPARHELRVWQLASAGAMTGILASFVLCPIELVKCRMQALSGSGMGTHTTLPKMGCVCVAKSVLKTDGVRGLYRGLSGMWAKEIPGSFVYFGSYELAKSVARGAGGGANHFSKPTIFLCGMFAGMCFCVTHPIESIKTRVQVTPQSGKQGFIKAMVHITKTEGLKPLCSGLKPNMVRACIYSGVQFVTYEAVKDFLLDQSSPDK